MEEKLQAILEELRLIRRLLERKCEVDKELYEAAARTLRTQGIRERHQRNDSTNS